MANVCGRACTTCVEQGKNCGTIPDGCGGTTDCGSCLLPETCGGGGIPHVCGKCEWTKEVADATNSGHVSLVVDQEGGVHLGYFSYYHVGYMVPAADLKYAYRAPDGTWSATIVDRGDANLEGGWVSLAVDAAGTAHISYYRLSHKGIDSAGVLKYASRPRGGRWTATTVDGRGDVGRSSSLVVDSGGIVHIIYRDRTNGDLKYAHRAADGRWTTDVVDAAGDTGRWTSMAVDSAGDLHVSYYVLFDDGIGGDLRYGYLAPGKDWRLSTIDSDGDVGHTTSLFLDVTGVYIAYYDATWFGANPHQGLKLAHFPAGGSWSTAFMEVDTEAGADPSFAIDGRGVQHVAYDYYDGLAGNPDGVKYAHRSAGGPWSVYLIDKGINPSLALDNAGTAHLSWTDDRYYVAYTRLTCAQSIP